MNGRKKKEWKAEKRIEGRIRINEGMINDNKNGWKEKQEWIEGNFAHSMQYPRRFLARVSMLL